MTGMGPAASQMGPAGNPEGWRMGKVWISREEQGEYARVRGCFGAKGQRKDASRIQRTDQSD